MPVQNESGILIKPEVYKELDEWRHSSQPPFPELYRLPYDWSNLCYVDLYLFHHIIGLSLRLHRNGLSGCAIWAQNMPM